MPDVDPPNVGKPWTPVTPDSGLLGLRRGRPKAWVPRHCDSPCIVPPWRLSLCAVVDVKSVALCRVA